MKNGEFPEELILVVLEQAETGVPVAELCRQLDVTEKTFYGWKSKYGFAEERMPWALEQAKNGVSVADLCRQLDVTEKAFHHWEAEYGSHEPNIECVDIFSFVQKGLEELKSYHSIIKNQARVGFGFGMAFIILGIAIIAIAAYGENKSAATAISIASVVQTFIGGALAYIHRTSLRQASYYYDDLIETQKVMLAIKLCGELNNNAHQDTAREQIIGSLLRPSKAKTDETDKLSGARSRSKARDKGSPPSPTE